MLDGLSILDADSHVLEPNDLWQRYVEAPFEARAPRVRPKERPRPMDEATRARIQLLCDGAGVAADAVLRVLTSDIIGLRDMVVEGKPIFDGISDEMWQRGAVHTLRYYLPAVAEAFSAASHAASLRAQGVDRTYVYPTAGLWILAIEDMNPELAAALVRAYNRWLRDYCGEARDFLNPVAAVCRHDPPEMVNEVRRVAENGWRSVYLRPNPVGNRTLGDPAYEPFWTECARLGVSVSIHEGTHARLETVGAGRFRTRFGRHACSHPMEQMMALLSLIEAGVLERHPDLRVAFMEAGCGWLPYWLWRLDHVEYENLAWEVSDNVRMKPSDYFRRQCFIACEPSEPGLEEVVRHVGAGCLIYGSDYPHVDHTPAVSAEVEMLVSRLGRYDASRVLWENPLRFYGGQ
jgi:predicted TIM-barrel fold metal-dependent hydrolase